MRSSFLNQQPVTTETTRAFIVNSLFTDATRLLFIVRSSAGPVGTIGLKVAPPWVHGAGPGEKDQSGRRLAELANLLRGSREGHPMLMYYAEMSLMGWGFLEFDIEMIWTAVPSDNRLALALHKSAGFKATELIPLLKSNINGVPHLAPGEVGQLSPDGMYAQRIELKRADFFMQKDVPLGDCAYGAPKRPAGVLEAVGVPR
jgi:hypothetical protein